LVRKHLDYVLILALSLEWSRQIAQLTSKCVLKTDDGVT